MRSSTAHSRTALLLKKAQHNALSPFARGSNLHNLCCCCSTQRAIGPDPQARGPHLYGWFVATN
jgi:hypothetical protein